MKHVLKMIFIQQLLYFKCFIFFFDVFILFKDAITHKCISVRKAVAVNET